jgi:NADH:ubiquinone oxidoreductase subunit E
LRELLEQVSQQQLDGTVSVNAGFCFEKCEHGPVVEVDGKRIADCTAAKACTAVQASMKARKNV